ncbi:MAG: hypothetical protein IH805_08685 [Proteobacteria bacterium]|nr:hypothetical protein [Pseudomonadota bacterium]
MSRLVLSALLGIGLAGCVLEPVPGMELKCQMTECVCAPTQAVFPVLPGPTSVPVLWKENGDAYCPQDHVLREAPEKK